MSFSKTEQSPPEQAPAPGTYRHYKGAMYQVLGMARHSETEEWLVVYQALYGEFGFWLRPLAIWLDPVTRKNGTPDNAQAKRFELVTLSEHSLNQLSKRCQDSET